MSSQATAGPETLVNTFTDNSQRQASITALADGGWVVTWDSAGQEPGGTGGDYGVYQQRYNADGGKVGAESHVNSYQGNSQAASSVAALADGGWLVTWTSTGQDGDGDGIYQRRHSADGTRTVSETLVNTRIAGHQHDSSVTALADGGWLTTWTSDGQDGSGTGVYQQRYTPAGGKVGAEARVNTTTAGDQGTTSSAALNDGGWVVTWTSNGQDGDDDGIYQQRYSASGGKVGLESRVNATITDDQSRSSVTALTDGGWVVTWASQHEGEFHGIYQQHFDVDGTKIGSETHLNTTTIDDQDDASVTALADGGWVVTWTSDVGSSSVLYQQRYNMDGGAVGSETLINSSAATFSQILSSVTGLADGSWVVAWQSSDGSSYDIHQRHFAADIRGGGLHDTLEGTQWDETLIGFAGNDTLDGKGGKDILIGGAGNDTYIVDSTGDSLQELTAQGTDSVLSTVSFSLAAAGNVENLTLLGSGNLSGTGNAQANIITGTAGKNTLNGGTEGGDIIDTLNGGAGDDTYVLGSGHDKIIDSGGNDTITSTVGRSISGYTTVENLTLLGEGNITGLGNALANVITGNSGNNMLNGGVDSIDVVDTLMGGAGNDTYVLGSGFDFIIDSSGNDTATSEITRGLAGQTSVENLTLVGSGNINGNGNALVNIITGNSGANILDGGPDSLVDTLAGGAGNDTYVLGDGSDIVIDTSGIDTITSTATRLLANSATVENLILLGTFDINGIGNALANTLTGNSGENTLSGEGGDDVLIGGAGGDALEGGANTDTASYAGALAGLVANLANASANTGDANGDAYVSIENLSGSSLNDVLTGNSIANVLTGGIGADQLTGGTGADVFLLTLTGDSTLAAAGQDTITDFSRSEGDRIDLSQVDAKEATTGDQAFLFIGSTSFSGASGELRFVKQATDTYVYGDVDGDKAADFALHFDAAITFQSSDFIL